MKSITSLLYATLVAMPFLLFSSPATAQQARPHVEQCAVVGYLQPADLNLGAVNICTYPIEVWIIARDGQTRSGVVQHDRVFDSGYTHESVEQSDWIWAACREGYEPEGGVGLDRWDAIQNSQYRCVRRAH